VNVEFSVLGAEKTTSTENSTRSLLDELRDSLNSLMNTHIHRPSRGPTRLPRARGHRLEPIRVWCSQFTDDAGEDIRYLWVSVGGRLAR